MTTGKRYNISTLSCVTEVYLVYHHQVHHIHRVTHSHCNRAIDIRHIVRVNCAVCQCDELTTLNYHAHKLLTTILSLANYCQEVFRPRLKFPGWAMPTLIFSRVGACLPCSPRAGAHAKVWYGILGFNVPLDTV